MAEPTYFHDYDREYLDSSTTDQKVEWFIERIKRIVLRPIEKLLDGEINDETCNANIMAFTALIRAMEYLGEFVDYSRYITSFAERYCPDLHVDLGKAGTLFNNMRWSLDDGCGLREGFGIAFGTKDGWKNDEDMTVVDPLFVLTAFKAGFELFSNDIRDSSRKVHYSFLRTFFEKFMGEEEE